MTDQGILTRIQIFTITHPTLGPVLEIQLTAGDVAYEFVLDRDAASEIGEAFCEAAKALPHPQPTRQ